MKFLERHRDKRRAARPKGTNDGIGRQPPHCQLLTFSYRSILFAFSRRTVILGPVTYSEFFFGKGKE